MASKRERMREIAQKRAGLSQENTLVEEIAEEIEKKTAKAESVPPAKQESEKTPPPVSKKPTKESGIRQTSFKILPENIRYLRYRSKLEHVQILELMAGIIQRDRELHPEKPGIPDFSEPLAENVKQNSVKAEYFSVRIYDVHWDYLSKRAMFLNRTVSSYLDDLITADRERYIQRNT